MLPKPEKVVTVQENPPQTVNPSFSLHTHCPEQIRDFLVVVRVSLCFLMGNPLMACTAKRTNTGISTYLVLLRTVWLFLRLLKGKHHYLDSMTTV